MKGVAAVRESLRSRLARRLVVGIVLASSTITLCLTALQLYGEYRTELGGIQASLRQVSEVHLKAMSESLWATNEPALRLQVEGLARAPRMEFIAVSDGDRVWAQAGQRASKHAVERQFTMSYAHDRRTIEIGKLTVVAGLDDIYRELAWRALQVLASNAVKTFLVAGFAFFLFNALVNRHLQDIAAHTRALVPGSNQSALSLRRTPRRRSDDLDEVVEAINVLRESVNSTIEARRLSEDRLRKLIDGLGPEMFVGLLTPEGVILLVNRPALAAAGIRVEDVLGIPVDESYWFAELEPSRSQLRAAIVAAARGTPSRFDMQIRVAAGRTSWVDFSLQPWQDDSGRIAYLVPSGRVIDDRKRAEEEVLRLNADLERRVAERTAELVAANRELEAFDYSISHDLCAPINRIRGFCGALLDDHGTALPADARNLVERMLAAGERMGQLVEDLLALATLTHHQLEREQVDVSALARSVLEGLRQADPERRVEWTVAWGIHLRADAGMLRAVLENLLGNAWKFTGTRDTARIEVGSVPDQDQVVFVRDNGVGFDMARADRLFSPFQRMHTQEEFPGTGIGLATVQRIVNRHGGRIWAEAYPSQGTTIYFTLSP